MAGIDAEIVTHIDEGNEVILRALTRVGIVDTTETITLASNDVVELREAPPRRIDMGWMIKHGSLA